MRIIKIFFVCLFFLSAAEGSAAPGKLKGNDDRTFWVNTLYRMAEPILKNMSRENLSKDMPIDVSLDFEKDRDHRVAYLEAFGRLMAGVAPWLTLPDDDTDEGRLRRQVREWALKCYVHAVDPESPDCMLWDKEEQALVDAAYLANSFLRAPKQLWEPLDSLTKQRYVERFKSLRWIRTPYNNWLLFAGMVETFLLTIDEAYDPFRIDLALRKTDEWYVGEGWYSDGSGFAFDYYNGYVIHSMYVEIIEAVSKRGCFVGQRELDIAVKRMRRYGEILERLISPEGTYPPVGRSITYRMGAFQPLALLALRGWLSDRTPEGQVRAALTAVMKTTLDVEENFNDKGYLQLGFIGHEPEVADWYTNTGSLYITSLVFLPLGLPADHSFWTSPAMDWTARKAWKQQAFPREHPTI